ncbi:MAG: hypothetical protein LUE14_07810 [Clostridiales bacterium]|nr:hypothetical protein [Clostridiales bacterium]
MKTFSCEVDRNSREDMVTFLLDHERYSTTNSWNRSTSYAHNLKIHNLGLGKDAEDKLYDILYSDAEGTYDSVNNMISDFGARHNWEWQAAFNGQSGGHLVLYHGGRKKLDYKSRCTFCGQFNYTSVEETGDSCGRCGKHTRVDLIRPLYENFAYPGKNVDMNEDWDMDELATRVDLVCEFDQLADDIVAEAVDMAENCHIEQETVMVPKVYNVLRYAQE